MSHIGGSAEAHRPTIYAVSPRIGPRGIVLVGFAEALSAPEVIWSLVDDGFQVVAFTRRGRSSALRHSRNVVCHEISPPEIDPQRSLSDLSALLASFAVGSDGADRILFPLDDTALWMCSGIQLDRPWLLAGPQDGAAELALNKHIQFQAAHEAGFNVPRFLLAQKADEIIRFTVRGSFPVILKPVRPVSIADGRIVKCPTWVCANRAELDYALEHWSERVPILIQELIAGIGEGVFGLSASDGVRAWSAHRRLRMMNPQGSGSSACVSVSVPEDVREKAQRFIDNTAWRGLFMLELLRDRAGKAWFIELNGRPWGSMALARRQGLEYPAWQARLAIDPKFEIVTEPIPIPGLVSRHVGREIMHLLFVMKGPKSKALTDWPRFWRTLGEVLRIHRRDSLYNWRRDDLRVFFADCYYTLYDNVFKSRS